MTVSFKQFLKENDKEDILSGLGAIEDVFVRQVEKVIEDLRNIRDNTISTVQRVKQEDPNILEPTREKLSDDIESYTQGFLRNYPVDGSDNPQDENAMEDVHSLFTLFNTYVFFPEQIKQSYIKKFEEYLRTYITDIVTTGAVSNSTRELYYDYVDDLVVAAYEDAFPKNTPMLEAEENDKEDILSGLGEIEKDSSKIENTLNHIKALRKKYDPYRNSHSSGSDFSKWLERNNVPSFMEDFFNTYPLDNDAVGEWHADEYDADTETLIHEYIYGGYTPEQLSLFEKLLRQLISDRFYSHSITDQFQSMLNSARTFLKIDPEALIFENVNGKEDVLAGLEELDSVNQIIQEVIKKGKEYNDKLYYLHTKREQDIDAGKDIEEITDKAYNAYDEAETWAEEQAERFVPERNKAHDPQYYHKKSITSLILSRYAVDLGNARPHPTPAEIKRRQEDQALYMSLIYSLLYGLIIENELTSEFLDMWDEVKDRLELVRI